MPWRDWFYFSKGERKALMILVSLIVIATVALYFANPPSPEKLEQAFVQPVETADSLVQYPPSKSPQKNHEPTRSNIKNTRHKETTSERVKRITSDASRMNYPRVEKLSAGSTIELNGADTILLKKIPGIGSSFANRIVKYRNLLGGFYTITQIGEVYGIDSEKYEALLPWLKVDSALVQKIPVNSISEDLLRKHPYINYRQAKAICRLRKQKKKLTGWDNLALLNEFTEEDKERILPYLSFD